MLRKVCVVLSVLTGFVLYAEYGAGEMKTPGRTFYLSAKGSNKNSGKSPDKAWKNIEFALKRLQAGDTLEILEGVHKTGAKKIRLKGVEDRWLSDVDALKKDGKPGAPIRIRGAENGKSVLTGALYYPLKKGEENARVATFKLTDSPRYNVIWEYPSNIMLERVTAKKIAEEYPGTFYMDKDLNVTVHFSAVGQKGIHASHDRIALSIQGSYVLIENLTFKYYREGIFAQQNMSIKEKKHHLTVRNCTFFNHYRSGVILHCMDKALVSGNRFADNGAYGSICVLSNACDNMISGNWVGKSPQTRRDQRPYAHNYAIQKYSGKTDVKNNYIGNVITDKYSFRWKPIADPDGRFEDNIVYGILYAESLPTNVSVKRNLFLGTIHWRTLGNGIWEKEISASTIDFKDNVRKKADFKNDSPVLQQALKLEMKEPEIKFPVPEFKNGGVKFVDNNSAVIVFTTPENDGWGSVRWREKGAPKSVLVKSPRQGVHHGLGISGLKPETVYEYQMIFTGRRGEKKQSKWQSFKTAAAPAAPRVITVDPEKMTLFEAGLCVRPGDTVLLKKGRHYGQFIPAGSGVPGKPITLKAQPGAVIDGMMFYTPLIDLSNLSHWVVDGISFAGLAPKGKRGYIKIENAKDIIVRNCRSTEQHPFTAGPFVSGSGDRFLIENNISWGGSYPIFIIGNDHVIKNNTIVNATFFSIFVPNVKNVIIKDNIFYRPCVPQKVNPAILFQNISGKTVCDGNVYFSPYKKHPVGGMIRNRAEKVILTPGTLKHWQEKSGFDSNSIHADPQFVNIKSGDFRLKDGSPAKGKGALVK